MSKKGRRAIVLTTDGEFRSVRLKRSANLSIGQTVLAKHLVPFHLLPKAILTPVIALGFSILCFIPLSQSTYAPPGPVAAYVYFDLKASVEASVDQNLRVISVQPLNNEARQLLGEVPVFQNMTFQQLSSSLLSKLNDKGQQGHQSLCLVTTVLTDQISHRQQSFFAHRLAIAFNSGARQMLQANGTGTKWVLTTLERKRAAEEHGLSAGKYLLYLRANAFGKTLTLEDAKRLSIEKINEISTSVSLPWSALLKEVNDVQKQQPTIEQASFKLQNQFPLFQNPFQVREPMQGKNNSSYLYPDNRTAGYA